MDDEETSGAIVYSVNAMETTNILYLCGEINAESAGTVIASIISINASKEFDRIVIFINSPGGSLTDGFALANVITASNIPVYTVALGECDSSGLIIAMSGDYRLIGPDATILSHQYSAAMGLSKHVDVQARYREFEILANSVIRHYSRCTGLSEKDVKKYLVKGTDVFLTPEEAISHNLFDEIFYDFGQVFYYDDVIQNEEIKSHENLQKDN